MCFKIFTYYRKSRPLFHGCNRRALFLNFYYIGGMSTQDLWRALKMQTAAERFRQENHEPKVNLSYKKKAVSDSDLFTQGC